MTAKERIFERFTSGELNGKTDGQIIRLLSIRGAEAVKGINSVLNALEDEGKIIYYNGRYFYSEALGARVGVVRANERGFAFLITDEGDFFIPAQRLNGALNKDKVMAVPTKSGRSDDEVEVIKIIERGVSELVGVCYKNGRSLMVRPDDVRYKRDVFISQKSASSLSANSVAGKRVLVKIIRFPDKLAPEGEIKEILGDAEDLETDVLSTIISHDLRREFPAEVLRQADIEAKGKVAFDSVRRDFTSLITFTIDGEDSRDFDDAVSIEALSNGYKLYVHIADVSHYVKARSALDNEAYERGTSVYFPDRVLPMLPEALSNGICSLNENENRYTLTAVMIFDKDAKLTDSEFCTSIIRSDKRFTYTQVGALLDGDGSVMSKYAEFVLPLKTMDELAKKLSARRAARGGINLDVKESYISVKGDKIEINPFVRNAAHELIEEFMLAANQAVAEYMYSLQLPFLYRVHESPSVEKAERFKLFIDGLGIANRLNTEDVKSYELQKILKSVEGKPYANSVNSVLLRSMQKARYSEENLGHFALASSNYCHFTSPIRRYPDLIVHRALKCVLDGRAGELMQRQAFMHEAGIKTSAAEKNAEEAEREVDALFELYYLSDFVGKSFNAVVSSVTGFGIFVQLDNCIEGIVRVQTVDDYLVFDEKNYKLTGSKYSFGLGDAVRVRLSGCDWGNRRAEFVIEKALDKRKK